MSTLAGLKIRRYRESATPKVTMEALGERLGVPKTTVYGWESTGKRAKPEAANKLALLGIADHADWYRPATCFRCLAESDGEQARGCRRENCPISVRCPQ
jgi:DNA-binding XRE family transcriptional regulator